MATGRVIHCPLKAGSRRGLCWLLLARQISGPKSFTSTFPRLLLETAMPSLHKKTAKSVVHLLVILLLASPTVQGAKVKPNIVFFLADDVGWGDVSFHGSTQIPTPNMDTLAADGVILNNYYVQPYCTPSRAALMTGLYPIRTGMQGVPIDAAQPWGLPTDVRIMPQYLKELGYDTHFIGKWHLGSYTESVTPTRRGFDSFYGFHYGEKDYYSGDMTYGNHTGIDFWLNQEPLRLDNKTYSTVLYSRRAQYIINNRQKSKPLFLVVSYQTAHSTGGLEQLQAPQENVDKFPYIGEKNRTLFAGMVDAMDQSVGQVFRALGDAGMLENTVIVFSSDNGGALWGNHNSRGVNWPLRGAKGTVWEGGTRAAAFVWSPLLSWKCRVSEELMHITDWLPTFYSIAGGNSAKLKALDGHDMWKSLFKGRRSPRTEILYNYDNVFANTSALRNSRYKLVLDGTRVFNLRYPAPGGNRTVDDLDRLMVQSTAADVLRKLYRRNVRFSKGWRRKSELTCGKRVKQNFSSNTSVYLFDVVKDPCELNNLADSHQNVVASLKKRIDFYRAAAVPVRNKPTDPAGFPENNNGIWAPWLPSA
ncbi:arylsulfatase B-like [Amblyomma americanum]